jgi:hypothetical protein
MVFIATSFSSDTRIVPRPMFLDPVEAVKTRDPPSRQEAVRRFHLRASGYGGQDGAAGPRTRDSEI